MMTLNTQRFYRPGSTITLNGKKLQVKACIKSVLNSSYKTAFIVL